MFSIHIKTRARTNGGMSCHNFEPLAILRTCPFSIAVELDSLPRVFGRASFHMQTLSRQHSTASNHGNMIIPFVTHPRTIHDDSRQEIWNGSSSESDGDSHPQVSDTNTKIDDIFLSLQDTSTSIESLDDITNSYSYYYYSSSAFDISPCRPSQKQRPKTNFARPSSQCRQQPRLANKDSVSNCFSFHTIPLLDDDDDVDNADDDTTTASCISSSASSSFCSILSSQSCHNNEKKKVRFHLDTDENESNDGIQYYPACHDLTSEDISRAWWSREERRMMKTSVSDQCQYALWNQPTYRRAALRALSLTANSNQSDTDADDVFSTLLSERNMMEEDLQILVHADVRGLERQLFARLQLPRRNSKVNIDAVLRTQELLCGIPNYNHDEKVQLLADQYAFNSNFAKKWARTLAVADAKEVYREMHVQAS